MKYAKPALSVHEQRDLLLSRGMSTLDPKRMLRKLEVVNYYRLSAYWHPFRRGESSKFVDGTTFEEVWDLYLFDRMLRLLMLDAIERIEVALKTLLAQHHSQVHGAFGYYRDADSLPKMDPKSLAGFRVVVDRERGRSGEQFVAHYQHNYAEDGDALPVWMAVELLPFGAVSRFYQGCNSSIQARIAAPLGVHHKVLTSWIRLLNDVRNTCAHHQRLWNRIHRRTPRIPNDWDQNFKKDRLYALLSITGNLLSQIAPGSSWGTRVRRLLDENPGVSRLAMGFPASPASGRRWSVDFEQSAR